MGLVVPRASCVKLLLLLYAGRDLPVYATVDVNAYACDTWFFGRRCMRRGGGFHGVRDL